MFGAFIFVCAVLIVIFIMVVVLLREGDNRVRDRVIDSGFAPADTFVSVWDRSFIALNFETMKIALGRKEALSVSDFSQIIQVDLLRNNATVTSTDKGSLASRALVGGVLLGGVGAVVGAVTAKTHSSQEVKEISLRVITENGSFIITFLDLKNSNNNAGLGQAMQMVSDEAERFYGLVLKAMRQANQTSPNVVDLALSRPEVRPLAAPTTEKTTSGIAGELEKLWQLKERGAISLGEYEKAKAAVLPRGNG